MPTSHEPAGSGTAADRRPGTVTTACVITWAFAALAIVVAGFLLLEVTVNRDEFVADWEKEPDLEALDLGGEAAATAIGFGMAVCLVLAAVAILAAVAAFGRSSGGRIALMGLSGLTAAVSLVLSIAVVPFIWVVASTVTLILLFTSSANAWYAQPPAPPAPPPYA